MADTVLSPGIVVRPEINPKQVAELTERIFGLKVLHTYELDSYDDRNFHVKVSNKSNNPHISNISPDGYVLKILNSLDSKYETSIDGQNALINHLVETGISTPKVFRTLQGHFKSCETPQNGCMYIVRLFEYIPGEIMAKIPYTRELTFQTGQLAGRLDKSCQTFRHPGLEHFKKIWNLTEVPTLTKFLTYVEDEGRKELVQEVIDMFTKSVVPLYDVLQKGIIHADFNGQNILVKKKSTGEYHVSSILDFGDSCSSHYVFEIAITMTYLMIECDSFDTLEAGGCTLAGYWSEFQLNDIDFNILKECICGRLVQSLVMGLYSSAMHPENSEYLLITSKKGWTVLNRVWNTSKDDLNAIWKRCFKDNGLTFPSYQPS